jgi:hypothetical protein
MEKLEPLQPGSGQLMWGQPPSLSIERSSIALLDE